MKYFVYNENTGKYECAGKYGKTAQEIAEEYRDVSSARTRQYAAERKLPYFGTDTKTFFYIFDEAAEEAFVNRPRESPGRKTAEKPHKIPGKPGRLRKKKPVDIPPKGSAKRPKKEAFDVAPKKKLIKAEKRK